MSILHRIEIVCGDIREVAADLLVLKYADGLYGADLTVAGRIGVDIHVPKGALQTYPGRNTAADLVAFMGVGELFRFRYNEIRDFAEATLRLLGQEHPSARSIATTIHGPGYGLDEREAFQSQIQGYLDFDRDKDVRISKLMIVEQSRQRSDRLMNMLQEMVRNHDAIQKITGVTSESSLTELSSLHEHGDKYAKRPARTLTTEILASSNEKPKIFAAMPFAEKYMDEYDIAFVEAAHTHGFLCERLDLENYVGDVVDEIFKRIRDASGVIALLNDNNPNVFLEVGYAMALEKPVILVAHKDHDVAFDLRGQNRQTYGRIAELRKSMTTLIGDLKSDGVLV